MTKKVYFFLPSNVGGAERMTVNIAKMLDRDKYSVHFVIVGKSFGTIREFIPENYDTSLLYVRHIWQFGTIKLIKCLHSNRPDIVFSSLMYLNARLVFAARIVGNIRTVIRNDSTLNFISGITKLLVKIAYPMADVIISQQDEMTKELCSMRGVTASQVKTLNNPMDKELIKDKLLDAESPYTGHGCVNFVNVASINKWKGQDVLLKAFRLYHDENIHSHLYLVGRVGDNAYYEQLKSYIDEYRLGEFVHFVGYTDNPFVWMKFADCFVLSSRVEGLPNTLIEANYLGVPCVSTLCIPAIQKIIGDGANGYIVPVDDYEAMSIAMKRALSLSDIPLIYKPSSVEDYRRLFVFKDLKRPLMSKVLIVATSRKSRGGITAVLKTYQDGEQWRRYHCHWVQTHRDGPTWRKLVYLGFAWLDFLVRVPFCDIVHVHISLPTTVLRKKPFVKVAKALGKKVIVHLHCGDQINQIWNRDYDYLFKTADVSVFLSENLKRMVEEHTGPGRDYRVIYNPCPSINADNNCNRKKHILFSGTLNSGKGYRDLICAFGKIADKYPDWKVVLIGNGEIDKGKEAAEMYGVTRQTDFPGWVSGDVKDRYFREAAVFCLPSYAEGFPMAVLDAWAYGIPVVTTPVGGIPDIAQDGENILLFAPGDVDRLAEQLEKIMTSYDGDRLLYDRIRKASFDFAENKFNVSTINGQLSNLYEELHQLKK